MEKTVFRYKPVRNHICEPIYLISESGIVDDNITSLTDGVHLFPASKYKDGVIAVITADEGNELVLEAGEGDIGGCSLNSENDKVNILINGKHFSDYVFSGYNKPFLGQIVDDEGVPFTRLDFDTKEHPHQRSLFIAVGDVNGIDCWNEYGNYGLVKNEAILDMHSASAYASFTAKNRWCDRENNSLVTEMTSYTVYNQPSDVKILDIETTFTADYGDVRFGATKEAGPLGIRVRDDMRCDIGKGHILNSWGGRGEQECWGRSAEWCDYSADIDEIGRMGITVFDNEKNERHPTAWHIRAYGLFAANNLFFKGGFTIQAGTSITYKYRVLFYRREMTTQELSDRYVIYTLGKR